MAGAEAIGRQEPARAEHDKERREIDEQHRAYRRGVEQAAVDQDELDCKEKTGSESRPQGTVAAEKLGAAHRTPDADQKRGARGANSGLNDWRDVMDRKFGRDLIEAP